MSTEEVSTAGQQPPEDSTDLSSTVTTHVAGAWAKEFSAATSTPPNTGNPRRSSTRTKTPALCVTPAAAGSSGVRKQVSKRGTSTSPAKVNTSDNKKTKMSAGQATTDPPDPTNADLAALMRSNMAETRTTMKSIEEKLEGKLIVTNKEIRCLNDRVTRGEATLEGRINSAVDRAVRDRFGSIHGDGLSSPTPHSLSTTSSSLPSFASVAAAQPVPVPVVAQDLKVMKQ